MSSLHSEWLTLVPHSGPFVSEPVLDQAFPQGLDELEPAKKTLLRRAYDEWREAVDTEDEELAEMHAAWIQLVLRRGLDLDDGVLRTRDKLTDSLKCELPEYGLVLRPDFAVVADQNADQPLLLIQVYAPDVDLTKTVPGDNWSTTPGERLAHLCKSTHTRLGIVTNGDHWLFVDAPEGGVTTYANWYSRIWQQEPLTLRAFVTLLGVGRYFCEPERKLPHLIDQSSKHQDEVTESLGEQVSRAVELLIQSLDRADVDRKRQLLQGVAPAELYEAALTVMMRLVFLLCAEERGLLLTDDERYVASYAVSSLRRQLREEVHKSSEEVLDHRYDAWSRLLAIFRAVYGGIDHETLRLPALGGSLFDPDRFPFLEGRKKGTDWRSEPAVPLPIDNRTVLFLLESIQLYRGRLLSFRALDIEQLGYVYEGLLDRTAAKTSEVTLGLSGTKSARNPWATLPELESARLDGDDQLKALLQERTGSSESRVRNDLDKAVDEADTVKLLTACRGDEVLRDRILPYFHFLKTDRWGYPLVYPKDSFMVTAGNDRRQTGTHYTPKSLTEAIVNETLEPVVYVGPAEGKVRESWQLRSPSDLLGLKVCDPAMGSGAFLVQVCRYLSERLVEAWAEAEAQGKSLTVDGVVVASLGEHEPLSVDPEERLVTARRLIAERCLYGVDINPLAVELAKLSIWLITLAKGRPFGFLDHNLRHGDSLLGIHDLDQLVELQVAPGSTGQTRLFGKSIRRAVDSALELRSRLRDMLIRDIRDVEAMAALDAEARRELELPECIADAFVGAVFAAGTPADLERRLSRLVVQADDVARGDTGVVKELVERARTDLAKDTHDDRTRKPFHWPLEFPEVFQRGNGGFDAQVGNPPFLGGQRITGVAGTAYRNWLVLVIAAGRRGSADLVAYFFLRACSLLRDGGGFGLLAVNTIAEGDTRQVGLEPMIEGGAIIHAAYPNEPWPGEAAVVTSRVHMHKGQWAGDRILSGRKVEHISAYLSDLEEWSPQRLRANEGIAYVGSYVLGMGFVLTHDEAQRMLDADPRNADVIFPYLNGQDLNSDPEQRPSRWVINFWDWSEERAKTYLLPYKCVLGKVKPERETNTRRQRRERWWLFAENTPGLYHAIGRGHHFERHPEGWGSSNKPTPRVLVSARVTKYFNPVFVPNSQIFSEQLVVLAIDDYCQFALANSAMFSRWVAKQASSMGATMRITPSDCFETFPFPSVVEAASLAVIGREFDEVRRQTMATHRIGLTELYNLFHSIDCVNESIIALRNLQIRLDNLVASVFGWNDLELDHSFSTLSTLPENDRIRFTICESVGVEVLRRFADLNKQRYQAEHEPNSTPVKTKKKRSRKKRLGKDDQSGQQSLFGDVG